MEASSMVVRDVEQAMSVGVNLISSTKGIQFEPSPGVTTSENGSVYIRVVKATVLVFKLRVDGVENPRAHFAKPPILWVKHDVDYDLSAAEPPWARFDLSEVDAERSSFTLYDSHLFLGAFGMYLVVLFDREAYVSRDPTIVNENP